MCETQGVFPAKQRQKQDEKQNKTKPKAAPAPGVAFLMASVQSYLLYVAVTVFVELLSHLLSLFCIVFHNVPRAFPFVLGCHNKIPLTGFLGRNFSLCQRLGISVWWDPTLWLWMALRTFASWCGVAMCRQTGRLKESLHPVLVTRSCLEKLIFKVSSGLP